MFRRSFLGLVALIFCLPSFAKENYQRTEPIHITREGQRWAERTLAHLSIQEKLGQLFMLRAPTEFFNVANPQYAALRDRVRQFHVGAMLLTVPVDGSLVLKNQPYEAAMLTNQLQRDSDLPLLFAADFERGLSNRFYGATVFPHSMAFAATGNPVYAETFARITAQEARAIGVQWNLFPIADVNSNADNPIINARAWSEDPHQVGEFTAAFIRSSAATGILTTAKHFPGHGDTSTDSHLDVARVSGDMERLQSTELAPFDAAIRAGVDAIMIAHVTVPALEPDPRRVATVSHKIVTEFLKEKMGFQGIVIPDAMDMAALTKMFPDGRSAVEAFKAGNDMIVIPADLEASFNAMVRAVQSGEISRSRLDDSVRKVLYAKASLGLYRARLVDMNAISRAVGKPESRVFSQKVADEAVTLLRDNGKLLPLQKSGTSADESPYIPLSGSGRQLLAVVFTDDLRLDEGRVLDRELKSRVSDAAVIYIDPHVAAGMTDSVLAAVDQAKTVVVAVYVNATSQGQVVMADGKAHRTIALPEAGSKLMNAILARAGDRTAVIAMGSPYLAAAFPDVQNYLCTYSIASVSEIAAAKALFGEISIHGHSPVTIPGIADRGAGLDRPIITSHQR